MAGIADKILCKIGTIAHNGQFSAQDFYEWTGGSRANLDTLTRRGFLEKIATRSTPMYYPTQRGWALIEDACGGSRDLSGLPGDEEGAAIDAAIAQFPAEFRLRAFPGKRFMIHRGASYWDSGMRYGEPHHEPGPMLYTFIYTEETQRWEAFAKGTPEELRREISTEYYRKI